MLVKLEAYHDGEHWCAHGIGEAVFTQGKTLDELMSNVKEAVSLHLEEQLPPDEALDILLMPERG